MSLHTKALGAVACLAACPSVSLTFSFALDADLMGTPYGTGILFTYSAVICVGAIGACLISAACDLVAA